MDYICICTCSIGPVSTHRRRPNPHTHTHRRYKMDQKDCIDSFSNGSKKQYKDGGREKVKRPWTSPVVSSGIGEQHKRVGGGATDVVCLMDAAFSQLSNHRPTHLPLSQPRGSTTERGGGGRLFGIDGRIRDGLFCGGGDVVGGTNRGWMGSVSNNLQNGDQFNGSVDRKSGPVETPNTVKGESGDAETMGGTSNMCMNFSSVESVLPPYSLFDVPNTPPPSYHSCVYGPQ